MLTQHMIVHILLMNLLAPATAFLWRVLDKRSFASSWAGPAGALQLTLLWGWHLPDAMAAGMHAPLMTGLMHLSLWSAAVVFWRGVIDAAGGPAWRALWALLFTGKLFCLLGVLLTFAPRPLYPGLHRAHGDAALLADQQLAGLVMLIACPLTYVVAATIIAAHWLKRIEHADSWRIPAP